ncbi:hypothetical protein B0H11DRAFT_1971977 [Mycena galericulata]|nr:hypothetical protein B0H11DRAFT_1971977 [Mycena galericulata]
MTTAGLRMRLLELDAQILDQTQRLDDLKQNRIAVDRELLATATFPVLTLPVEITAEIFGQCLPTFDPTSEYPHEYYSQQLGAIFGPTAPVTLMGVCRRWRDIVLATPSLWSTLKIEFDKIPARIASEPRSIEGFIERWLDRAAQLPLSIIFIAGDDDNRTPWNFKSFTQGQMRDIIHRYSQRVRYLELGISDRDIRQLGLDSTEFPLLQSAMLGHLDIHPPPVEPSPAHIFHNASKFQDLRLVCNQWTTRTSSSFALPWLQLTKFDGEIDNLDLFTLAPNLSEVLCLCDFGPYGLPMITHSRLESLTVNESETNWDDLLRYLTLPALRTLDVSRCEGCEELLPEFLIRSSPPLLTMTIPGDFWEGDIEPDWLDCASRVGGTLEKLTIESPSTNVMDTIFQPGYHGSPSKTLSPFPNIRSLRLIDCTETTINYPDLVSFLYSRSDKLRDFQFRWVDRPTKILEGIRATVSGHFARMATAGMDIYVGSPTKNFAKVEEYDFIR